jgi:hypothetical protein
MKIPTWSAPQRNTAPTSPSATKLIAAAVGLAALACSLLLTWSFLAG